MNKREIIISKNDVRNYDLGLLSVDNYYSPEFFRWSNGAGVSEFRLYAYLSEKVNDCIILEIGTRHGGSTTAFSANPKNIVISYDIVPWETHEKLIKSNIDLRIGNFMEDETIDYNNVDIIMIDVDPHDGIQEPPMVEFLKEKKWSGILIVDDISTVLDNPYPEMRSMWLDFPYEKYDVSDIGHYSGTGIVNFGEKFELKIVD